MDLYCLSSSHQLERGRQLRLVVQYRSDGPARASVRSDFKHNQLYQLLLRPPRETELNIKWSGGVAWGAERGVADVVLQGRQAAQQVHSWV
jgi:hypothetical protein